MDFDGIYAAEGAYSAVHYPHGDLPDDDFVRVRNGVSLSKGSGRWLAGREVDYGLYLGLSYRFAGDLSSVRLVIGAPF